MRPIQDVAADLGLSPDEVMICGDHMAKVRLNSLPAPGAPVDGRIILVSAINPTPAGEGKTTLSIRLAQGLRHLDKSVALALREPSLGPIFGMKGGGAGGGMCMLEPSTRINMHFTGNIHAVGAAHNLLAALIDNAIHHRSSIDLEHRQLFWRRVLDVNDRALRHMVIGLGGIAVTILLLVFGEVTPKIMASRSPARIAVLAVPLLAPLQWLLRPRGCRPGG